ncbi:monothiol glutaredoxin-S6-like [Silene latifolia]|uniref:monothiol glutaredoxin-S6-like n=1 Tax=Silene latifolia TaxID=37657 RepID=UPI003D77C067
MDAVKSLVDEKPLVIFSKSSCCVSHSMKQLMSSYGANPIVYELDEIPNGQEIEKALKRMGNKPTVPTVYIGQNLVGGANEVLTLQVQGKLVPMLKEAGAIWVWNRTSTERNH